MSSLPTDNSDNPVVQLTTAPPHTRKASSPTSSNFGAGLGADVEANLDKAHSKIYGATTSNDGVDQDALGQVKNSSLATLMSGAGVGGLAEVIAVALNFFQSYSLAVRLNVSWPKSFQHTFCWLSLFSLDFEGLGGESLGVWCSTGGKALTSRRRYVTCVTELLLTPPPLSLVAVAGVLMPFFLFAMFDAERFAWEGSFDLSSNGVMTYGNVRLRRKRYFGAVWFTRGGKIDPDRVRR